MTRTVLFTLLLQAAMAASSQTVMNGCLNGTINGLSSLPDNWSVVTYNDPVCEAGHWSAATPDLCDVLQPASNAGVLGTPYCGCCFVSGLRAIDSTLAFHEGIKQYVTGFFAGATYTLQLRQAVVRQNNALDTSGAWSLYLDTTLVAITEPSVTHRSPYDPLLDWDLRTVTFTATATAHWLKLMPTDDDAMLHTSFQNEAGALRMGIDAIGFLDPSVDMQGGGTRDEELRWLVQGRTLVVKVPGGTDELVLADASGRFVIVHRDVQGTELHLELPSHPGLYVLSVRGIHGVRTARLVLEAR